MNSSMNNSEIFEKKMKGSKTKLIVALVLIAMAIINEFSSYVVMKKEMDNPVAYEDVEKVGQYTCIDAEYITYDFANYSSSESSSASMSYYFIEDEENTYIASMSNSTYKKFDDIIEYYENWDEEAEKPDSVRVCGLTETIPSTLRTYAVKALNENFEEGNITNAMFDEYFKYYINTERGPQEDFQIQSMVAGVFGFVGLIFAILYLNDKRKTKKTLSKYANELDKIKMEIAAPDTIYNPKTKMFLTSERIVNVASGMEIYDFKDIIWLYPHELRQNGYTTQRSIYVVTKDTKPHMIANISTSKKNNIAFDELYESLLIRIPDAMHGYTQENRDKVREMSKKK